MWTTNGRPRSCGEPHVAVEIILLHVERREVPMPIEARLADRHDARLVGERDDPVPVARLRLGDVVRLHADGRVHAVELGRQPHADGARGRRGADRDDVLDASLAGPRDDFRAIGVEVGLIQMRMRVEELHGDVAVPKCYATGSYTTGFAANQAFERGQMPLRHLHGFGHQRLGVRSEIRAWPPRLSSVGDVLLAVADASRSM